MKCTECNRTVKPVVAIDIDGTLGDFHGHFEKFLNQYLAVPQTLTRYKGSISYKEWAQIQYGISEKTWHDIKLAYRQGGLKRSMPMYYYASALTRLVIEHAELWITTTRPYLRLDNVDPDTRFWLSYNAIRYDGLVYDEDKYQRLREIVGPDRVVAVLDDLVEECIAANRVFGPGTAILRINEYNTLSGIHHIKPRVESLPDIGRIIMNRIEHWNKNHE